MTVFFPFPGMDSFQCVRLLFRVKALSPVQLPPFQGSMLRGAFGMALLRSACVLRQQRCSTCILRDRCIYSYTFETPLMDGAESRRYANAPHPFVLNIETGQHGIEEPGSTFAFGITLIGRAIGFLPYFIHAIQRMGEMGVGRGRGTFELLQVFNLDAEDRPVETVYEQGVMTIPSKILGPEQVVHPGIDPAVQSIRLHFITPLRLVRGGDLCREPIFHVLVRNLLRRLENLTRFHCDTHGPSFLAGGRNASSIATGLERDSKEDTSPVAGGRQQNGALLDLAETVRLREDATRWYDWERYSSRQDRRMRLGGLVGEALFEGELAPFLPLLTMGSWVNIGKGTTFGLGRFRLRTA